MPTLLACLAALLACATLACAQPAHDVASPDGRLVVTFRVDDAGVPRYEAKLGDAAVLADAPLGLVRDDADLSRGLTLDDAGQIEPVADDYELLTSKRRRSEYRANRRAFALGSANGGSLRVVFQVSNDGLAFRYEFPDGAGAGVRQVKEERTTFRPPAGTRAWLQPMSAAKTGWARTFPSYEEHYLRDVPVGTKAPFGAGWVYPALFRTTGDAWLLVSESGFARDWCGTRLVDEGDDAYRVGLPDSREGFGDGPVNPRAAGGTSWASPWRVVVVGTLATIAESTLGTDVAPPAKTQTPAWCVPGKAAWSWVLLKDEQTVFDVQRKFVDYAADMRWRYVLVDALWDTQIGHDKIAELVKYADAKDVKVLVWLNSNGDWNDAPQTPRHKLLTAEGRRAEFARLRAMGVAGVKIDFFGGDGQSMMAYYLDLLDAALEHELLVNFHGATLPRGLQRAYPNLMTVEAIRGQEFITFEQADADRQPAHAALLPFTRNAFDPMDFTPVVLDRIPRIERRTTRGFELACAVLFTSGIQHYAETPDGMAKQPAEVVEFLRAVPSVWDDTRFLAGDPGKHVALARRGDGRWWLAGVNAEDAPRELVIDVAKLRCVPRGRLIVDDGAGGLTIGDAPLGEDRTMKVTLPPRGGFVASFPEAE